MDKMKHMAQGAKDAMVGAKDNTVSAAHQTADKAKGKTHASKPGTVDHTGVTSVGEQNGNPSKAIGVRTPTASQAAAERTASTVQMAGAHVHDSLSRTMQKN
eukprot:TRINITY_DN11329_c0_g1_i1.p1 TRINITY_DN11329_c0_g1~~TRINITY_DN11329_c0_g1_i1.p1  ORF type:complete len:102 (-),score=18.92 TRINITY_DN11329_c0_g1_i1:697-1002(-)